MQRIVGVELFCMHCNRESLHQAFIADETIKAVCCIFCGTQTHVVSSPTRYDLPSPLPVARLDDHELGQGQYLPEGAIELPAVPFMQKALAAVRIGRSLRERDCRVLRLVVNLPEELRLIVSLKASLNMPVLADIGRNLELAAHVSHADGVIFTCTDLNDAGEMAARLPPAFPGPVVIRTLRGELQTQAYTAVGAARLLCAHGLRNLALSPSAAHSGEFAQLAELLRRVMPVPLRIELPLGEGSADPIVGTATALGVACHQPHLALVGMPAWKPEHVGLYDVVGETVALLSPGRVAGHDTLGTVAYMAGKAFDRIVSKPGRLLHEMESAPGVFIRTFPSRLVSKPQRVLGEIQRLLGKIS